MLFKPARVRYSGGVVCGGRRRWRAFGRAPSRTTRLVDPPAAPAVGPDRSRKRGCESTSRVGTLSQMPVSGRWCRRSQWPTAPTRDSANFSFWRWWSGRARTTSMTHSTWIMSSDDDPLGRFRSAAPRADQRDQVNEHRDTAATKTFARDEARLKFGGVEPTGVLWRVVHLEAAPESPARQFPEDLFHVNQGVNVQVVEDEMDAMSSPILLRQVPPTVRGRFERRRAASCAGCEGARRRSPNSRH